MITSKLTQINKSQKTVKMSIPKTVQDMMKLNAGDRVEFVPNVEDGEVIFYIKKVKEDG